MPGDSEHPVTVLGDLRVVDEETRAAGIGLIRPATVADLVSALRAEGEALDRAAKALSDWDDDCAIDWWSSDYEHAEGYREYYRTGVRSVLDALSVSDPITTEPPKDPWDYDP